MAPRTRKLTHTPKPTELAPRPATKPARRKFPAAVEREVGALVPGLNRRIRLLGQKHESLADDLVRLLFDGPDQALAKEEKLSSKYLALRERAGRGFHLDPKELYAYVRVGAITALRPDDDVWPGIGWSEKLELLPLLALDDRRAKFNEGVRFAAGPNVGKLHVREWVQNAVPKLPGALGRPRGATVTLRKGEQLAETGIQLGSAKHREAFAKRLQQVPLARRRELVRDLKKTTENLAALLELIDIGS